MEVGFIKRLTVFRKRERDRADQIFWNLEEQEQGIGPRGLPVD